jgi:RNA polymerase II elongation factor ELL
MSTSFKIPQTGLSLHLGEQSGDLSVRPNQIMRLNLVQSTLDDLIQSLRKEQPARLRLGKHPSLHFGGKSHSFHAYPETHRSEIYHSSDKESLYFTGILSHSLEVEKAKNATAATDQALADLEEKLNAHERGKESKKTHIISHPDELRGLRGSKSGYKGPTSKVELEKDRFLKTAAIRSLTASPTLGAPKSPAFAMTPTSAPIMQDKDRERLEAARTPTIHLLAIRAVSAKFLARQTRMTIEDGTILCEKYGTQNRINAEKYGLKDKFYKELDPWNFNYTPDDRTSAIEGCISAYDRMRISKSDPIWQKLLPKAERGKGKCLSRLNLRTAPPPKPVASKAKVNSAENMGKDNETDRVAPKGATSEPKSTSTLQKTRTSDKDVTKKSTKLKSTNSTLTGRVTKKAAGKTPAKLDGNSKIKSAEFVLDSDDNDDTEMADAAPAPAPKQQPDHKRASSNPKTQTPKIKAPVKPRATEAPSDSATKVTPKVPKPETAKPKLEPTKPAHNVTASKRPPSRPSTSPQKPSPLGHSPPANASDSTGRNRSDSQNQSSGSSSSSPLIAQLAKTNKVARPAASSDKPAAKVPAHTNGVAKTATKSLKRKAESDQFSVPQAGRPTGNLEAKRHRAVSTSSGGSTGSASPPMSNEILWQKLQKKSRDFKLHWAKYRTLHDHLSEQRAPPTAELDRLRRQHKRLEEMKKEIWEEDRKLRRGLRS